MRVLIADDYDDLSRRAADIIAAQVIMKPDCVLGLATGSSPVGAYRKLIERYESGTLDFSDVTTINLDEYVGLKGDDPQSYAFFMRDNLFDHVNISPDHVHIPSGIASDIGKECERYDQLISQHGGMDLLLLGIGENGHIGFNEPGSFFIGETHEVELEYSTISANARLFSSMEDVPRRAITMGMSAIMQSDRILLIANGEKKADAIYKTLHGHITPEVPSSILQLHRDVTIICDREAACNLAR